MDSIEIAIPKKIKPEQVKLAIEGNMLQNSKYKMVAIGYNDLHKTSKGF